MGDPELEAWRHFQIRASVPEVGKSNPRVTNGALKANFAAIQSSSKQKRQSVHRFVDLFRTIRTCHHYFAKL